MTTDPKQRKQIPLATGCLDYFPDALLAVAHCSWVGNEQHNPGKPLHWDRSKSGDEADALMRHFMERGKVDKDGVSHTAKVAWRALSMLQKEIEEEKPQHKEVMDPTGVWVKLPMEEMEEASLQKACEPKTIPCPGCGRLKSISIIDQFPYCECGAKVSRREP